MSVIEQARVVKRVGEFLTYKLTLLSATLEERLVLIGRRYEAIDIQPFRF